MTPPIPNPLVIPGAVRRSTLALALLCVTAGGCGAPGEHPGGMTASFDAAGAGDSPSGNGSGDGGLDAAGHARCVAPPGVSASPQNTEEAIQLLNALPKPTTVACFLESLARPVNAFATKSQISAQPALSARSPRVFVKLGALWLSVVIDGDSSYLMEFGELVGSDPPQSVKGELKLPLDAAVAPSAPYDRVQDEGATGTVCSACHQRELRAESIPFANAFSSDAYRPRPNSRVSIDNLRVQEQTCDRQVEPHRCEMLSALFGGGTVTETPFPASMPTFF